MTVKHANGMKAGVAEAHQAPGDLGNTASTLAEKADLKDRATAAVEQGKEMTRRRPVPLATAAAGVVTAAVATAAIVRKRRARPTPKQRAVNAWRGMRKRLSK